MYIELFPLSSANSEQSYAGHVIVVKFQHSSYPEWHFSEPEHLSGEPG